MDIPDKSRKTANVRLLLLMIGLAAASLALINQLWKNTAAADSPGTVTKTIKLYGNDDPSDLTILKNRLDIFAGKGKYSLVEENGCLTLRLPISKSLSSDKTEFLLETFLIEPGPGYAACSHPEAVNSAFYTIAAITPEDIRHIDKKEVSVGGNNLPEDETLQVPVLKEGNTASHRLYIKLKDALSPSLHEVLERGDALYLLNLCISKSYETNRFSGEGWRLLGDPDDPCSFYIEYSDSDELYGNERILEYNLTHAPLSKAFNYCFLDEVEWADPDSGVSSGVYQRNVAEIGDTWYFFEFSPYKKVLAADERANVELLLCRRLDLLQSPYAIGFTQEGGICVRMSSGRINRRVINLLRYLKSKSPCYIGYSGLSYNFTLNYLKIHYDMTSSSFVATLSNEDFERLEDTLKDVSTKETVDLFLCTEDGPLARSYYSPASDGNRLLFRETIFTPGTPQGEDYSWFTALLENNADIDSFDVPTLYLDYYYMHDPEKEIFNDPGALPLKEIGLVSMKETEEEIRQILPQAEVGLSYDSNTLDIHMNLEHGEDLPDRIYEYAPRLLEICSLEDSYYSSVRIYPCDYKGDERAWLVFSKDTKEGKTDISFSGYLYNGRMDAYADRILELEKTNSFFRDMIIDPGYDGWKLRDF